MVKCLVCGKTLSSLTEIAPIDTVCEECYEEMIVAEQVDTVWN